MPPKKPPSTLERLLDSDDDSTLEAAVANKKKRSQSIVSETVKYKDQHGETTMSVFSSRSLLTGTLYRQYNDQVRLLDYSTGFLTFVRSKMETEKECQFRERKFGIGADGPGPRTIYSSALLPLFPLLLFLKHPCRVADELEEEADRLILEGRVGDSAEVPVALYQWTPGGRRTFKTKYVIQITTYAYAQRMKMFVDPPMASVDDLRIDIRIKTSLDADKTADKSSLSYDGLKFGGFGYTVEFLHFVALLRSDSCKKILASGKQMVNDFFSANPSLDPEKFLMTPRADDATPGKKEPVVTRKPKATASQYARELLASQSTRTVRVGGHGGEDGDEDEAHGDDGRDDEDDDGFGKDDDDAMFRDADLNETVPPPVAASSSAARGRKVAGRASRK